LEDHRLAPRAVEERATRKKKKGSLFLEICAYDRKDIAHRVGRGKREERRGATLHQQNAPEKKQRYHSGREKNLTGETKQKKKRERPINAKKRKGRGKRGV